MSVRSTSPHNITMVNKVSQMSATDEEQVRRSVPMPVKKAKVVRTPDHPDEKGHHQVYVKLYEDESQERVAVLTGMQGDVSIPSEGEDVMVLFRSADKAVVLGTMYPVDDVRGEPNEELVPDYEEGDRIIGNVSDSHLAIRADGTIEITTEGVKPINVDRQNASVYLSSAQTVAGDDAYDIVGFDTVIDDAQNLFDAQNNQMVLNHGGTYTVNASVAISDSGQANRYSLAVFINDTEFKRVSQQSTNNKELSVSVRTVINESLSPDDKIDIRVRQDSGTDRDLDGSRVTSEFSITRMAL